MKQKTQLPVVLRQEQESISSREEELAYNLKLKILLPGDTVTSGFYLQFTAQGLSLFSTEGASLSSIRADFAEPRLNYRVRDKGRNQNIAKAVGLKAGFKPHILDGTAGLGKDAYLLASLGCKLDMLERSPVVHCLLSDAMKRASSEEMEIQQTVSRMNLLKQDFLELDELEPGEKGARYDTVYLDPMFPQRSKSARVKKDMFMLQKLLGNDDEELQWLKKGRKLASKRVVVKRAKLSAFLAGEKPDIQFKGSSSRFDVYLMSGSA